VKQQAVNWQGCFEALVFSPEHSEELVRLDDALKQLASSMHASRIVEIRFLGVECRRNRRFLGNITKTVKRDWSVAKAWLHGELRRD
jgi:hypothetical protein